MIYLGPQPFYQFLETLTVFSHRLDDSFGYLNYTEYNNINARESLAHTLRQANIHTLIVDASIDPWDPTHVKDLIEALNLPFRLFVLTSNYAYARIDDPCIIYFPLFLIYIGNQRFYGHSPKRKYLASCLNRVGKEFRAMTLLELYKKPYGKDCYVTFHNYRYPNNINDNWRARLNQSELAAFDHFTLPINPSPNEYSTGQQHQTNTAAYYDSYLSIVTESTVYYNFISEKTAKAILAKQLFTVVGPPGIMRNLQNLGFDMYYDVIDHNHYDFEPDWRVRIKKMFEVLDPIMSFETIAKITTDLDVRLKRNATYLKSEEFVNTFVNPIVKKIL